MGWISNGQTKMSVSCLELPLIHLLTGTITYLIRVCCVVQRLQNSKPILLWFLISKYKHADMTNAAWPEHCSTIFSRWKRKQQFHEIPLKWRSFGTRNFFFFLHFSFASKVADLMKLYVCYNWCKHMVNWILELVRQFKKKYDLCEWLTFSPDSDNKYINLRNRNANSLHTFF